MSKPVRNPHGFVLMVALLVLIVMTILGLAFLTISETESRIAFYDRYAKRALYVAEMGVERARRDLKYDARFDRDGMTNQYFASPTPVAGGSPADCTATIPWQGLPPQKRCYDLGGPIPTGGFLPLYTNPTLDSFGDGSTYTVLLGLRQSNKLTIRSEGTGPEGATKVVDVRAEVRDLSVWGNAAFAGGGGSGARINGNVVIAGSVHILGQGLGPTGIAADFGGGAGIFNWYNGLDPIFTGKVPDINPSTLDAEVRVKEGIVLMNSGAARVGNATSDGVPGGIKLRVDGIYTDYGFAGTYGDTYVFSDNGTNAKYDVPPDQPIQFPSLTGPRPDGGVGTYEDYLDANSWDPVTAGVLPASAVSGSDLRIYANTASFDVTDGTNRLAWDSISETLTVQGIIRIPGSLTLGGTTGPTQIGTINYTTGPTGGTFFAKRAGADWSESGTSGAHQVSITVNSNLLPLGIYPTAETLGFIAKDRLNMERSNNSMAAAVFAENQVQIIKQYHVVGAVVSRFLDMGSQVPHLYQMPNLVKYLPPGMPGGEVFNYVKILSWREL
ncbi:MAG TPA: pilus assembly PilX N-terminal domain-containing protein [Candidatus Methylomirabilis sp.]|nr:pilus assembly PilX N-terminal domain-containing protein [Candidatus Methylomirabilis sp.]